MRFWLFSRAQKREKHTHLIGHTLIDFWVRYSRIYTRKSRTKIIFWSKLIKNFGLKLKLLKSPIKKFLNSGKNSKFFVKKSFFQIDIEVPSNVYSTTSISISKTDFLAKILEFFPEFWKKIDQISHLVMVVLLEDSNNLIKRFQNVAWKCH